MAGLKIHIALDAEAERQAEARQFGQTETAFFGTAETQVGKAAQRVAVLRQFGRQPCRRADWIEEFDDRNGVEILKTGTGIVGALSLFGLLVFGALATSIGVQFLVRARPTR